MTGFGYAVLGFGSHPSRGPPALSISLNKEGFEPINLIGSAGANVDSTEGDIDVTASAAGGDTSGDGYAYAWTLSEPSTGEPGFDTADQLSVQTAGTQNAAQYNGLILRGVPAAGPPATVFQILTCTVTDDAGDTADIAISQAVIIVAA
jgi:hypothetical protein